MVKHIRWVVALAVGSSIASLALEASADNRGKNNGRDESRGRGNGGGARQSVPEIPVGGAAGALTLLLGGTAIALDRRRRQAT